ncbi:hypothetical protein [Parasphingorhabdus pacifica]
MNTEPTSASGDVDGDRWSVELPTMPCSVVWSNGHSFVLEGVGTRARWAGVDDRGRARFLTDADLQRRGWSHNRS